MRRFWFVIAGLLLAGTASAQTVAPRPSAAPPAAPAPASTPAPPPAADAKIIKSEVQRKGRTGYETFIATYLTLDKNCKVGPNPKLETPEPPKNGKLATRPNAINLRAVPGAPRGNCIGTSPYGLGVFYRADRRFKGEDTFVFHIVYPNGDIREVSAKVTIQ